MLAPKLTSSQWQPRRSAPASRADCTTASVSSEVAKAPWMLQLWLTR